MPRHVNNTAHHVTASSATVTTDADGMTTVIGLPGCGRNAAGGWIDALAVRCAH